MKKELKGRDWVWGPDGEVGFANAYIVRHLSALPADHEKDEALAARKMCCAWRPRLASCR